MLRAVECFILCLLVKKQTWFHFPSVEISDEGRCAQKKHTKFGQHITHSNCLWYVSAWNIHASLKILPTWPWTLNLSIQINQKHYLHRPWKYHMLSSKIKMWLVVLTTAPSLWWKLEEKLKLLKGVSFVSLTNYWESSQSSATQPGRTNCFMMPLLLSG